MSSGKRPDWLVNSRVVWDVNIAKGEIPYHAWKRITGTRLSFPSSVPDHSEDRVFFYLYEGRFIYVASPDGDQIRKVLT